MKRIHPRSTLKRILKGKKRLNVSKTADLAVSLCLGHNFSLVSDPAHTCHKGWSPICASCTDTRDWDQNLIGPILGP